MKKPLRQFVSESIEALTNEMFKGQGGIEAGLYCDVANETAQAFFDTLLEGRFITKDERIKLKGLGLVFTGQESGGASMDVVVPNEAMRSELTELWLREFDLPIQGIKVECRRA